MHPLIQQFFKMTDNKFSLKWYCERNGLNYNSVKSWRKKKPANPSVASFNEALNMLGYELEIVVKKDLYKN